MMRVTALLAHPDDELMCAGTLARFVDEGHTVELVTMFVDLERREEWQAAAKTLGVSPVEGAAFGPHEDGFAWTRENVMSTEHRIFRPDLLISHRAEDANTSHGHVGRIARTLARKNRMSLWEVDQSLPGGIDPDAPPPNHFVDITAQMGRKRDAVACYASQLDRYPGLADALEARDRLYGWQLGMGTEPRFAEGFRIHKSVWL